jgi:hypothetical protein
MSGRKISDLRKAAPELAPDRDYPPPALESLKGKVSAAEWQPRNSRPPTSSCCRARRRVGLLEWPAMRRFADRLDPPYKN